VWTRLLKANISIEEETKKFLSDDLLPKSLGRSAWAGFKSRVARFFLLHDTKTGINITNEHKMYRMVIQYPKYP
jgi:hypothetical protein